MDEGKKLPDSRSCLKYLRPLHPHHYATGYELTKQVSQIPYSPARSQSNPTDSRTDPQIPIPYPIQIEMEFFAVKRNRLIIITDDESELGNELNEVHEQCGHGRPIERGPVLSVDGVPSIGWLVLMTCSTD